MVAKVLVFGNHKGGVGKTTLALNLADALHRENYRVLVVDIDPQANTSKHMLGYDVSPSVTLAELFRGESNLNEAIVQDTNIKGVHLLPSHLDMVGLEWNILKDAFTSATLLRETLAPIMDFYDLILVDTPPSLGFYTTTALVAANAVFVPIESGSKFSLVGTDDYKIAIDRAKKINPGLTIVAGILTKHDARKIVCKMTAENLPTKFATVLETFWPETTQVAQAFVMDQTVLQFAKSDNASKQIRLMAREIIKLMDLESTKRIGENDGQ